MPPRSNLFQDVVGIIHRHMAEGAVIEESAMVPHRITGPREVDVTITSRVAGHEVMVAVEATSSGRRADVQWVEQQTSKHEHMATSKLVLVSEAGFTADARRLAEETGAVAISPTDLGDADPSFVVVNKLRSIWPKTISITPQKVQVWLEQSDGESRPVPTDEGMTVVVEGMGPVGTLRDLVNAWARSHMGTLSEKVGLADMTEDRDSAILIEVPGLKANVDGKARRMLLEHDRSDGEPALRVITGMRILGDAKIRVSRVDLTHRRLGEVSFAAGEGRLGDCEALFVFTEGEEGGQVTIRTREPG